MGLARFASAAFETTRSIWRGTKSLGYEAYHGKQIYSLNYESYQQLQKIFKETSLAEMREILDHVRAFIQEKVNLYASMSEKLSDEKKSALSELQEAFNDSYNHYIVVRDANEHGFTPYGTSKAFNDFIKTVPRLINSIHQVIYDLGLDGAVDNGKDFGQWVTGIVTGKIHELIADYFTEDNTGTINQCLFEDKPESIEEFKKLSEFKQNGIIFGLLYLSNFLKSMVLFADQKECELCIQEGALLQNTRIRLIFPNQSQLDKLAISKCTLKELCELVDKALKARVSARGMPVPNDLFPYDKEKLEQRKTLLDGLLKTKSENEEYLKSEFKMNVIQPEVIQARLNRIAGWIEDAINKDAISNEDKIAAHVFLIELKRKKDIYLARDAMKKKLRVRLEKSSDKTEESKLHLLWTQIVNHNTMIDKIHADQIEHRDQKIKSIQSKIEKAKTRIAATLASGEPDISSAYLYMLFKDVIRSGIGAYDALTWNGETENEKAKKFYEETKKIADESKRIINEVSASNDKYKAILNEALQAYKKNNARDIDAEIIVKLQTIIDNLNTLTESLNDVKVKGASIFELVKLLVKNSKCLSAIPSVLLLIGKDQYENYIQTRNRLHKIVFRLLSDYEQRFYLKEGTLTNYKIGEKSIYEYSLDFQRDAERYGHKFAGEDRFFYSNEFFQNAIEAYERAKADKNTAMEVSMKRKLDYYLSASEAEVQSRKEFIKHNTKFRFMIDSIDERIEDLQREWNANWFNLTNTKVNKIKLLMAIKEKMLDENLSLDDARKAISLKPEFSNMARLLENGRTGTMFARFKLLHYTRADIIRDIDKEIERLSEKSRADYWLFADSRRAAYRARVSALEDLKRCLKSGRSIETGLDEKLRSLIERKEPKIFGMIKEWEEIQSELRKKSDEYPKESQEVDLRPCHAVALRG